MQDSAVGVAAVGLEEAEDDQAHGHQGGRQAKVGRDDPGKRDAGRQQGVDLGGLVHPVHDDHQGDEEGRGQGEADDIAELIALVAAPGSTNIHGAIVSSDRGVTAG